MIICGVKVSHDGGVAVIDGDRLAFSLEVEKLGDSYRHSELGDLDRIPDLLQMEGLDVEDIDQFVVDGWYIPPGRSNPAVPTALHGMDLDVPVAPYVGNETLLGVPHRYPFPGIPESALRHGYVSYTHASNHVFGAYCSSPFARRAEDALVLVWDGGMTPRLYHMDAGHRHVTSLGPLFPFVGNVFAGCCERFGPFSIDREHMSDAEALRRFREIPGKAMAYAALGSVVDSAFPVFRRLLAKVTVSAEGAPRDFGRLVADERGRLLAGLSDADIIASFQAYLGDLLVRDLGEALRRTDTRQQNLCIAGGCALNITWNTRVRESGLFAEVWVPPFPNDAGAAIGTASCEFWRHGRTALRWSVYKGPKLQPDRPPPSWHKRHCNEHDLAELLCREGEPVVVLSGRAELGPRALGNRSIVAPAAEPTMKDRLNRLKKREDFRPVAPVCLESQSATVFTPGGTDPYMLFEHRLRAPWAEKLPTVVHLDGTARLQTIEPATQGTVLGRILHEYHRITGIPVLCNTSANLERRGFFSSVAAAANWGRARYVWSDDVLYTNPDGIADD